MTQEEIDQMTEYNSIHLNLEETQHSCTVFNPIFEIGKLPYEEAKDVMWEIYLHQLTEDEYALMTAVDSPVDFFKKVGELGATSGICRRCGCKWDSPCIDKIHGACWWVDEKDTICSHCFYHFNDDPLPKMDAEAFLTGFEQAQETKLLSEELLKE